MDRTAVEDGYRRVQARFAEALLGLDPSARLDREQWQRPGGGGGESWTLSGDMVERAAVNVSAVWGDTPPGLSERMAAAGPQFYATGVSIIVHPVNPHAPTFHANVRYFESEDAVWFGGGADLTPHYLYDDDARHFHLVLRNACERHPVADHEGWKRQCDEYFYLPHRGEHRGIGGLFFDHLTDRLDEVWAFQRDLGAALVDAYLPILARRVGIVHSPDQTRWQELRRGRYVEFNLVWDRGTRFGLETGGRTSSVLASLPPRARWDEAFRPGPGSPEHRLVEVLSGPPRPWV